MTTRFTDHLLSGVHGSRPSASAVPQGTLYSCSTHSKIYKSDGVSAWSDWLVGAGAVSLDSIWDAKGDIAVATGPDAASKLAVGTNGQVFTADSSQTTGTKWADAAGGSTDGWTSDSGHTWTYASATTFTISGVDLTAVFTKGTRLKLTQTTVKYFTVVASSFSTNTTVTITGGTDYTFANAAVTNNYYSYQANPAGWPTWFTFAPALTGFSATPTVTAARFAVFGTLCYIHLNVTGTSNATTLGFTYPIVCVTANVASPTIYTNNTTPSTTYGCIYCAGSTNAGSMFLDVQGTAWTASGTKASRTASHMVYEF